MREIVDTFGVGWLFDPSDARSIRECVERAKAEGGFAPESWARVREELAQRSPVCHAGELERIYAGQA
ncbi:MAG: hypothetical protein D6695_08285 [Planctomycetota bacterium]|nr:MAG: hypothetical protein D6695_08285 [Planctomycetota bacterium]